MCVRGCARFVSVTLISLLWSFESNMSMNECLRWTLGCRFLMSLGVVDGYITQSADRLKTDC